MVKKVISEILFAKFLEMSSISTKLERSVPAVPSPSLPCGLVSPEGTGGYIPY